MEETQGDVIQTRQFEVFPNPTNGVFTIRSAQSGEYQILNGVGQVVDVFNLGGNQPMSKEVQDLSAGIYYVRSINDGLTMRVIVVE
jgi:hypothetical protein